MCVYIFALFFVCVFMCVPYCKIERKGGEPDDDDDDDYYLSAFLHNRKQRRIYTQTYLKTHKHIL